MCWPSRCATCRMIFLFSLLLACATGEVKCLLNALAIPASVWSGLLKFIVMFLCWVVCLFERVLMVFHKICVFLRWSQFASSFSFQMVCLCCLIWLSISLFKDRMLMSERFCLRSVFLCWMRRLMCGGSAVFFRCRLPFGM